MKADPVRLKGHEILTAVDGGQPLDRLLVAGMDCFTTARDKAFLAELVRGSIQWRSRYDHLIDSFSRKHKPDPGPLRSLLRMSLHQLLGMDGVPAYAAIHQAGQLCRRRPGVRQVGFVNGLLQAVRREIIGDEPEAPDHDGRQMRMRARFRTLEKDRPGWIAAWHSHPRWLVERWVARYGDQEAEAICAWNNRPVPLTFHVLPPMAVADAGQQLADAACPVRVGAVPRSLVARERPNRTLLDSILVGAPHLIVQDQTVQAATGWLLEGLPWVDGTVLDMCASPGGKTAHLAALLPDQLRITAMDRRADRVTLLAATLKRIERRRVDVVLGDGIRPPFGAGTFRAVLLDGPCSGTGVLRHHPEGRWRLNAAVPAVKGAFLLELAGRAADLLTAGGRMMYGTCSLETEENESVVEALLAQRDDLEPDPDTGGIWQRSWLPHTAQGDGFFAVRLKKKD